MFKKKTIPFIVFIIFLVLDVFHYILNEIYKPYSGFGDNTIHILLPLSGIFYIGFFVYLALLVNDYYKPSASTSQQRFIAAILLVTLGLEAVYAFNFGDSDRIKLTSASGYNMLWPAYMGGLLPGILTVTLARLTLKSKKLLALFFTASQFWIAGPIVTDNLFLSQGGYRGYVSGNPLPFITYLDIGYQYTFFLILILLFLFISISIIVGATYGIYFILKNRVKIKLNKLLKVNINQIALSFSVIFLCLQIVDWAGFISD